MPREVNRVAEITTTTGTGSLTLGGAVLGYRTFLTALGGSGNTEVSYMVEHESDGTWEVGRGTYLGGPNQIQRDLALDGSSGAGTKVNFAAGIKKVFVARIAEATQVFRARFPTDTPIGIRPTSGQSAPMVQSYTPDGSAGFSVKSAGGVGFGAQTAGSRVNFARHIDLYDGIYGINVTSGRINYVTPGGTTVRHDFVSGDDIAASVGRMSDGTLVVESLGYFLAPSQGALLFGDTAIRLQPNGSGQIQAFTGGSLAARIDAAGSTAAAATTVMTREKGDNRYVRPGVATTFSSGVTISSGGLTVGAGGATVTGGLTLTNGAVQLTATGAIQFGSASNMITPSAENAFVQHWVNGSIAGRMEPAGSSIPNAASIITREKGDARYAAISSLRYKDDVAVAGRVPGFLELDVYGWTWGGTLADDDPRRDEVGYGLVAEQLSTLSPRLVEIDDQGRPDRLNVGAILGALHAEIAHLSARVDNLAG